MGNGQMGSWLWVSFGLSLAVGSQLGPAGGGGETTQ